MDKIEFKAVVNGEEKDLYVRRPNYEERREGQKVYNRAFNDAIQSKATLRIKLNDVLEEQGLWSKEKQRKFDTLREEVLNLERRLQAGGMKLAEGRAIALQIKKLRNDIFNLTLPRIEVDAHTAERQSEDSRFNYFASKCSFYKDDTPAFANLDDYLNQGTEDYAIACAEKLAKLLYNADDKYEDNLPENKFLKKFKFIDIKGRLINKDGHLVDEDNRLVNEDGRYVNEKGELVDIHGRKVDQDGNFVVEFSPFLDDDGNPILETEVVVEAVKEKVEEQTDEASD
jgi:hypothetical protein